MVMQAQAQLYQIIPINQTPSLIMVTPLEGHLQAIVCLLALLLFKFGNGQ